MKSFFIDTNYFIRFLLRENEKQFQVVYTLFQKGIERKVRLLTSSITIFEVYWVLSSFYKKDKDELVLLLEKIIRMNFIDFENIELLKQAVSLYRKHNLDLEDCYAIASAKQQNAELATFDVKLQKVFRG